MPPDTMPLPPGDPHRLGATLIDGAVLFSVWAPEAQQVWLCLFDETGRIERERRPLVHCHAGVWHGRLDGAGAGCVYAYRAHGPWAPNEGQRFNVRRVLLDPYAREIVGRYAGDLSRFLGHDPVDAAQPHPDDNAEFALKARVVEPVAAPTVKRMPLDPRQRVIAELHVRSATALHPGIPEALRGTYAGLAHPVMIEHWHRLGVTTLELLPVQQRADEARLQVLGLSNHWGYTTIGYFAAEPRYASGVGGHTAAEELRMAIATLRAAGFEVLLDMVFNHTAETDELGPTLSMRGLANRHWYRLSPANPAHYANWSGCGNCLNLAEPQVLAFVIEALRHWVESYGVDGFRFDLATTLGRESAGGFSAGAAFFGALQADPVLKRVLCIAEPWDLGPHGYQAGQFPAGWLEWNDQARDTLRAYWLRPDDARSNRGALAQRLAGSSERFGNDPHRPRPPQAGVNFITAHDGFTLRDLVSHRHRHNHDNGEHNRDGHHDNLSVNAGVEGASDDPQVTGLRVRWQRALLATLMLARGTPMLLAGDEIGHSQQGNNNAYCQDNAITWLGWAEADASLTEFVARLVVLRRAEPALHGDDWWRGVPGPDGLADVAWYAPAGALLLGETWHTTPGRALMARLAPAAPGAELLLLFNPEETPLVFRPPMPVRGSAWRCLLDSASDTGAPLPAQASSSPEAGLPVAAHCVQVWRAGPESRRSP